MISKKLFFSKTNNQEMMKKKRKMDRNKKEKVGSYYKVKGLEFLPTLCTY